jgi:hypothetical protein
MTVELFAEAKLYWDLEYLYADIASIKRLELTEFEKKCLRGLLCRANPQAIASKICWKATALRTELSRRLYPYISTLVREEKIAWHNVAELLSKSGYKYPCLKILKTDLFDLVSNQIPKNRVIRASTIIYTLENKSSISGSGNSTISSFDLSIENLIQLADKNAQQDEFCSAINLYYKALMIDASLISALIKIARCYDRLKLYKDSFFICDLVLHLLEHDENCDRSQKQKRISQTYLFLAGVFHELAINTYQDYYVHMSLAFYGKSQFYYPHDILPAWNIVDLFISVFQQPAINLEERTHYIHLAKLAYYNFKGTILNLESNFSLKQEAIVKDATRSFTGLDDWWQQELDQLKTL